MNALTDIDLLDLREQLAARAVVVVVGSGVSAQATDGAPTATWKGLLESGLIHCQTYGSPRLSADEADLYLKLLARPHDPRMSASQGVDIYLAVGHVIETRLDGPRGKEWTRWLESSIGSLRTTEPRILDALHGLNAPLVTTNYDSLLLESGGERLSPVTWMDAAKWVNVVGGSKPGVLYLHGWWDEPESVVLGARAYERLISSERAQTIQRTLGLTKTLLFVGFGGAIADPNVGPLLDWLARSDDAQRRHYILLKKDDCELFEGRKNVHPISYGPTVEFLTAFLEDLPTPGRARGRLRVTPDTVDAFADGATFTEAEAIRVPKMVIIPSGELSMGSPPDHEQPLSEEQPVHAVHLDYRFAVSVYPVTFEEWDEFERHAGSRLLRPNDAGWGRGGRPVINVSWFHALEYLEWLNNLDSVEGTYRLLTEAEWEYVARANTPTRYWWGPDVNAQRANYDAAAHGRTVSVGQYPPNPFGVYDILGNVWEWVQDRFHPHYTGAPEDGSAWEEGDDPRRVVRGGCWYYDARFLEPTARLGIDPEVRFNSIGFRVARTVRQPLESGRSYSLVSVNSGLAATATPGGYVVQDKWSASLGQLWELRDAPEGILISPRGEARVLSVEDPTDRNYSRVVVADYRGDPSQLWRADPEGDGYVFVNVGSGKVLDVEGISKAPGGVIIQFARHGNSNQRWWSRRVRVSS